MKKTHKIIKSIFLSFFCFISCLGCGNNTETENLSQLQLETTSIVFNNVEASKSIRLSYNGDCVVTVDDAAKEWCEASLNNNFLTVKVTENNDLTIRKGNIKLTSGSAEANLHIEQLGAKPTIVLSSDNIKVDYQDTVIAISVVTNAAYDIIIPSEVSWIKIQSENKTETTTLNHLFELSSNDGDLERSTNIIFKQIDGVAESTLTIIQQAREKTYTQGEIGDETDVTKYINIFNNEICSELKPGVTYDQIKEIDNSFFRNLAFALYDETYDRNFRIQSYEAYRPLGELAKEMKTSEYNSFENPTGIYFEERGEVVILIGETYGQIVYLTVSDFTFGANSFRRYNLKEGINKIKLLNTGLGYFSYYTRDYKTVPPIKANIASGIVNGYFDKNLHTNSDWATILSKAKYEFIDIKGDYVNLCYLVQGLQNHCPNDGLGLIENYDKLIDLQWDLMGLKKYGRVPKNHMFGRRVESGFFADGIGAGFDFDGLCDVDKILTEHVWGIAHEFGHVNQIRPGLKWVSTTEVTNNVYSISSRYVYYPEYMNLEMEKHSDCEGRSFTGGRYISFLNSAIRDKEHWLCQRGPDQPQDYEPGMQRDHFVKLIPIWQLLLYYRYMETAAWHNRDWYGDLAEIVRNTDESQMTNGELQLRFLKNTMDILKQDLSDFFVSVGMLTPIDEDAIDDYSKAPLRINQSECDELINYAKKYPKPATPVLYYLSFFSREAFEKQLPVIGVFNKGINELAGNRLKISSADWQNVAVYEAYQGNDLKYITMVGAGDVTGENTYVVYPEGCTRLEAVGADGKRILVYGNR